MVKKIRIFLICVMFVCLHCNVFAGFVDLPMAQKVASSIWKQHYSRGNSLTLRLAWDSKMLTMKGKRSSKEEAPLFYVFSENQQKGFVIVSAEDQTMPILAYSFTDAAPSPENLPASLQKWFENVLAQLSYIRENGITNTKYSSKWSNIKMGSTVVELQTAKWDQSEPFNNQCPLDGDKRSLAGCVAVAAAIVMKYHQWPKHGSGFTETYTTENTGLLVNARNLNHEYRWDLMPMTYLRDKYSEQEAEAVSTLLADIGAAFQSNYGANTTLASIDIVSLYESFGYSPSITSFQRDKFSDAVWLGKLKEEISQLRPVLYRGESDEQAGHQFVLDGFTDDDYFHVNWGWGGSYNGYFTLSTLVPGDSHNYNHDQWAWFNVAPSTSSEVVDWIKFTTPGILITDKQFEQYKKGYFDKLIFENKSAVDFSGTFRGAIANRKGDVKEWITRNLDYTLQSGWYVTYSNVSYCIQDKIDIGDRIRFYYKSNDSNHWELIKSTEEEGCLWEVLVADEYYIEESTSFSFNKKTKVITLLTKEGVEVEVLSASADQVKKGLSVDGTKICIDTKELSPEVYTIRLRKGDDLKELKFSVKPL